MKRLLYEDLKGKLFGFWEVIGDRKIQSIGQQGQKTAYWLCRCKCGREKSISQKSLVSGISSKCIWCRSRKPDGDSARKWILASYKRKAKERGLIWSLLNDEFYCLIQSPCFYCGIGPTNCCRRYEKTEGLLYSGIDRVDNSSGYVSGNVVSCCAVCNQAKHTMSASAFISLADRIVEYQKKARIVLSSGVDDGRSADRTQDRELAAIG